MALTSGTSAEAQHARRPLERQQLGQREYARLITVATVKPNTLHRLIAVRPLCFLYHNQP